ncbi:serine hydrolase domain-containing protein [Streptomyces sp. AN091965]|uniref:serine hydrolase domain-containing protein n=1 Tax=Streptomyces sp. AN091965 TaxID=2927803 RepID=UPI001F6176DF|nr:serine hydrolase domain-containing protein [Streptomyces sp. AN091965]MCI3930718.1 beta-lactamase family protein [Streptomyces sp. AN091965]
MAVPRRLTPMRRGCVAAALVAAVAGALTAPAAATPGADRDHRGTRAALDAAVRGGVPGVTAHARDRHGPWSGAAGVGDLREGTPRGAHDRFRAASITKTFVATVLLQLEAEGRLDLDDPVGAWLPGVIEGHGHDGDRISVRQLLNHTSGIHDYSEDPDFDRRLTTPEHRHRTWRPAALVALALRHAPDFAPGRGWAYSNTNYVVAGMVIEKVTGRPYGDEVRDRIIIPLHLRATSVPGTRATLPRPSSRAYSKPAGTARSRTYDVTELNPSMAGAAGELISDAADLNRFYTALLRGDLLPPEQLAAMKRTVPARGEEGVGGRYGLGLLRLELPCGTVVWGHGGGIHGSLSLALTTTGGGHALTFHFNGDWAGGQDRIVAAEFCGA